MLSPDGSRVALIRNSRTRDESVVLVVDGTGVANGPLPRVRDRTGTGRSPGHRRSQPRRRRRKRRLGRAKHERRLAEPRRRSRSSITTQPMAFVGNLAWLVDGSGLLMVAADALPRENQIWACPTRTGQRTMLHDANRYRGLTLSADSAALVTGQHRSHRTIWVAPTNHAASPRTRGSSPLKARAKEIASGYIRLCWTPDGQVVYTSVASGTAQTGAPIPMAPIPSRSPHSD